MPMPSRARELRTSVLKFHCHRTLRRKKDQHNASPKRPGEKSDKDLSGTRLTDVIGRMESYGTRPLLIPSACMSGMLDLKLRGL